MGVIHFGFLAIFQNLKDNTDSSSTMMDRRFAGIVFLGHAAGAEQVHVGLAVPLGFARPAPHPLHGTMHQCQWQYCTVKLEWWGGVSAASVPHGTS